MSELYLEPVLLPQVVKKLSYTNAAISVTITLATLYMT